MSRLPASQRVVHLLGPRRTRLHRVPLARPGAGELLVKVEAATTCGTDLKVYRRGGHPRMLEAPCAFGHEMAGVVAAVGPGVTDWREGDRVVVANSVPCGACAACRAGRENLCEDLAYLNGAFAEFLLVPPRFVRRSVYRLPGDLDFAHAALAEPLACVLHGIGVCGLDGSRPVAVIGGGPIGQMFVAVLSANGHDVTLADPNPDRVEIGRRLGAKAILAVRRSEEDAGRLREIFDGAGPALVVEATGRPEAWAAGVEAVAPGGQVLLFGGCAPGTSAGWDTHKLHYSELTVRGAYHHRPQTFAAAVDLLASGRPDLTPLLSEERSLEELPEALRAMADRRILKAVIRPGS